MDHTWRIFTAAILTGMAAAAVMLLARDPDTGSKPGGQTIGGGAADLNATIAIRGGP
jgi:hypothetical protein